MVVVKPNGYGGSNGTWVKSVISDVIEFTDDLDEALLIHISVITAYVEYVKTLTNGGDCYSSNPSTPPPNPPGV